MSSQTPNINLTLPTGAENVSRQIINDNNTKIDTAIGTLNGKINAPVIEGEYSTVLSVINAFKSIKALPFCVQKAGNSAYTDLPSFATNTSEWCLMCYGSQMRLIAELTIFTGEGSHNKHTYKATIYNGAYVYDWGSVGSEIPMNRIATYATATNNKRSLVFPANYGAKIIVFADSNTRYMELYVKCNAAGTSLYMREITKGNNISYSASGATLTITVDGGSWGIAEEHFIGSGNITVS